MADEALNLLNDDTTNVGALAVADITSPASKVPYSRICVGASTTLVPMDSSNPGYMQLTAGTAAIGKLAANSGVDIGDVDILSIAAGDNNIGNVDIVTLPSGNLGQQLSAASLSVTPATDVADGTYIGDIKFGEALPAGSAIIGDVRIDQTTPGTTNGVVEASAAGILTAVQLIDNAVSGAGFNITQFGGAAVPIGAGLEATALRVTLATDSTGVVSIDDNSGSITVDATALDVRALTNADVVTAELSATDNAVLDTINTAVVATQAAVEGTLTVGSHAVTNAGTFLVQENGDALTALQLIDDSIFADDAAFTLTSSKVTVSGAIRDDALGTLTAIEGDAVPLRVNSTGALHVTGGGGGTEYTLGTDTFTEATSIGSISGVVRYDAGGSLVNTDNEITALQVDSAGALRVTGGGGGTEYNEDVATPATIVGTATLVERDDAITAVTPIEGDWIGLRGTAEGALWVQDFNSDGILADTNTLAAVDYATQTTLAAINAKLVTGTDIGDVTIKSAPGAAAVNIQDGGNSITVDGTVTANPASGTIDTVTTVTTCNLADETTKVIGTVNIAAAQTLATVTTVGTVTTCSTVTTLTGGGVAHDGVDSGNPIKIGARATASQLGETPVAAADRTDLLTGTDGALLVRDGSLEDCISESKTNTDGASTAMTGSFAATASQRIYLTDITISNSSATFCTVDIRDGAAGSVLWTFPVPATGGVTHRFRRPLRFTANTALAFDASAATTTIAVSVSGFKNKA